MRVNSRQQRGTRGTASRHVVHLGESHPPTAVRQRVDVGRLDFRAEAAHVAEAEIIGEDDYDVGSVIIWICHTFIRMTSVVFVTAQFILAYAKRTVGYASEKNKIMNT